MDKVLLMCEKEIKDFYKYVDLEISTIKKLQSTSHLYERKIDILSNQMNEYRSIEETKMRIIRAQLNSYLKDIETPQKIDLIKLINDTVERPGDMVSIMRYIAVEKPMSWKDVVRQAYALCEKEFPVKTSYYGKNFNFTCTEYKTLKSMNLQFSINEIDSIYDPELRFLEIKENIKMIEQVINNESDPKKIKIYERIKRKLLGVPENSKMMHIYHSHDNMEVCSLDESVLHKLPGKKARIVLMDKTKVVGYLGCDFQDDDGDDCVSIFENCDQENQFLTEYQMYKFEDISLVEVIEYNTKKNFCFRVPAIRTRRN